MMQAAAIQSTPTTLSEQGSAIVRTLLYFDIFRYPLSLAEIARFTQQVAVSAQQVDEELDRLVRNGMVQRSGDFYFINGDGSLVQRRLAGNELATRYLSRAASMSAIIASFPFVKAVMISGSLSKNYMDEKSDIDYFIITEPGRMWLCRSFLAGMRKLLPGAFKKYFCINYFIDTTSLGIPDRNIFTATELLYIYPTFNHQLYAEFMQANTWIAEFYPNCSPIGNLAATPYKAGLIKKLVEKALHGQRGDKADAFLYRFMLKRWKQRYSDLDENSFNLNIRTKKNVSKHHEKGHQGSILKKHEERMRAFEERFSSKLV